MVKNNSRKISNEIENALLVINCKVNCKKIIDIYEQK